MICYILIGMVLTAMIIAVAETRILRVRHYELCRDRSCTGAVPRSNDPEKDNRRAAGSAQLHEKKFRIVIVSDLHCTRFGKKNIRLIEKIKALHPDIMIVAGDVINGRAEDSEYAEEFFDALNQAGIKAYYTFGNHEQKLSLIGEDIFDAYESNIGFHVTVLNNKTVSVDGAIELKGLLIPLKMYRDRYCEIEKYFDAVKLAGRFEDNGHYHILVAHDPTYAELYKEIDADLIIGGHLHGGIIRIPFIGGIISPRHRLFPRRTRGMYDIGKSKLLVTSGVGWHALPFRFCNDPQICVLDIKR
ncbi:MAG: metallophosphoesterase [Lachnospiraceae bacterium]|nr:metallophosphoesterase [Lachnospiraceae bacterium]